jgi:hypothetical protein
MLETKQSSQENWHLVVQAEEGSCSTLFLHEGKVGLEQKGIVVIANKALPE